jgi:lipopolysaccharide export system permease protein
MHRRNEIIAMRCAGVNILQITKSLILTAAVLGAINLAFEAAIAPHAVERIAEFMVAAEAKAGHGTAVNGVTFANRPAGRIWFFGEFDGLSATAKTVLVHCYGENGNETARIFAKSAIFDGDRNCWKFSNCTVTPFSEETNGPIRFDFFGEKYFEDFDEHPRIIGASMKKIRDLSFGETVDLIKYSRGIAAANGFSLKFHGTFANAVSCILVLLLAIPFAVSGIKVNPVVGAAKASIFFLLFLICGVIFSFAGRGGFVAPLTAAWAANAIAAVAIGKLLGGAM